MTWKCDACGKEREDAKISVLTYPLKNLENAEYNYKYCNDTKACMRKAAVASYNGLINTR